MVVMARRCCTLLLLLVVFAAQCAPALADGDPASDFLLEQPVFLSTLYGHPPTPVQQELISAVRTANRHGFHIRVAVIASSYDLGSVTQLWRKPRTYARFLGIELSFSYKGRLLVVMPNGFGFNWPRHPRAASERMLAQVPVGPGEAGEIAAATAVVRRLAAAGGVSIAGASHTVSGGGRGWALAAGAGLALALALALGLRLVRGRRRGRSSARPPAGAAPHAAVAASDAATADASSAHAVAAGPVPAPAGDGAAASELEPVRNAAGGRRRGWPVYALPAAALLVAAAAAVPVIASSGGHRASHSAGAHGAGAPQTPYWWSAGQRPAPGFELTDQDGRRVSPSAYRGRPLIITFIDPLCRNLCPLEAHVLNQLDRSLPASQRPVIIAVSVDLWADTRADLLQDYSKWGLVPQWRWAVGSPSQLEAVWRSYAEEVDVETKRIAGTTVHYIGHDEMAYLIDPQGDERALFLWPFTPAQVERTLRQFRAS
jgi:protein SCO1